MKMANNITGIYPGTFDPITFGHIDIIKRSLNIVDKLIIGVANNRNKIPLFTYSERHQMIKNDINMNFKNLLQKISVSKIEGLLTDFAEKNKVKIIIRGLRVVSDFEYEFQMTGMNYQLNPNIETVFLMSSEKNSFISSNFVKEVHRLGGNVNKFISLNTIDKLNKKNN